MRRSNDELCEEYGFGSGRCPRCRRKIYFDGAAECNHCGWVEDTEREDDEETEDE